MKYINYLLNAFAYRDVHDFSTTVFKLFYINKLKISLLCIVTMGTLSDFLQQYIGINFICSVAFLLLTIAEWQTGIRAAVVKKGERIKSRKIGRMILKIGVYMQILFILNSFAVSVKANIAGFEISPFGWLYYVVLSWIIVQMLISYFENLSTLGYAEARGVKGVILRKFNKWFEFDGSKDADNFNK